MEKRITNQALKERRNLVKHYREVKAGKVTPFSRVQDLAAYHEVSRKWIWELNGRYEAAGGDERALLPRKRGPKRPWNRPVKEIERLVVAIHRRLGKAPVHIQLMLRERGMVLSVSGIRNILGRYPLPEPERETAERYEKQTPGELGHIDVKKMPNIKGQNPKRKFYEAALLDDCTRLAYRERVSNKKAKTLSRFVRRALRWFQTQHGLTFQKILSDNGKEFTARTKKGRQNHAFETTLRQEGVTHAYTRPYRPQTNGKVERFWRIWMDEFFTRQRFRDWADYDREAQTYWQRYNQERRHGGINYETPAEKLARIMHERNIQKAA
jgi:transposase InsO family protein